MKESLAEDFKIGGRINVKFVDGTAVVAKTEEML